MSGSIQKFGFDGTTYLVQASGSATHEAPATIEGMATSGQTIFKNTKKVENVTGMPLIVNALEFDIINNAIKNRVIADMFYVDDDGFTFTAKGRIVHEGRTTDENLITVTAIPLNGWTIA